ncbi:MAG: hypothetical protein KIT13_08160 [Burkholderiales bacterium]|nr:hypothetical protein [Burkholderiales bacterium]
MTLPVLFGVLALLLHLAGYAWYALGVLRGRTRPNAASWFMWLVGAWVEYRTFDAIDSHWTSSALPLACFLGCCAIFAVTAVLQFAKRAAGSREIVYQPARGTDYLAVGFDLAAWVLYVVTGGAAWANALAVTTSIVSFVPIWKTTLRHGHEAPGPWFVWCAAYLAMLGAVLSGPGTQVLAQSVYPVYYFLLSAVVLALPFGAVRGRIRRLA